MIRKIAVAAAIAAVGIAGQAMAAQPVQLGSIKGAVLVNQNGRYVAVKSATSLRAGDRVIAREGSARLTFADGCSVAVAARSMVTIGASSPCGGSSGVVKVANQYESREGTYQGQRGTYFWDSTADLWMFLGFGVVTAVVVGSALSDSEESTSP